jgi:hypothetical protein
MTKSSTVSPAGSTTACTKDSRDKIFPGNVALNS